MEVQERPAPADTAETAIESQAQSQASKETKEKGFSASSGTTLFIHAHLYVLFFTLVGPKMHTRINATADFTSAKTSPASGGKCKAEIDSCTEAYRGGS